MIRWVRNRAVSHDSEFLEQGWRIAPPVNSPSKQDKMRRPHPQFQLRMPIPLRSDSKNPHVVLPKSPHRIKKAETILHFPTFHPAGTWQS
jgi:hypothetical protein